MPYANRYCEDCGTQVTNKSKRCRPCHTRVRQAAAVSSRFCVCGNSKAWISKQCQECHEKTFTNSPELRADKAALQRKYNLASRGLTVEEYELLVTQQGGRCKICEESKSLVVDHDHATGLWRGLICRSCNLALGYVKDNPAVLRAAADYLEEAVAVPEVM